MHRLHIQGYQSESGCDPSCGLMDSSRERLSLALIRESLSVVSSVSIAATKSLISLITFLIALVQSLTNQTPL